MLQNEYNPVLEFKDYPITLEDKIVEKLNNGYTKYFGFTEFNNRSKQFIQHCYTWHLKKGTPEIRECLRIYQDGRYFVKDMYYQEYGCARGWHITYGKAKGYWGIDADNEWYELKNEYLIKKLENITPYIHDMQTNDYIIQNDPSLKYFAFNDNTYTNLVEYIKIYKKHPIVEMAMKLGLNQVILNEKFLVELEKDKTFKKWVFANKEMVCNMKYKTMHDAYKSGVNPLDYRNSLLYRIECGKEISSRMQENYKFILKYINQEDLTEWLTDNGIGASSYNDYVSACRWLQLDFNDTKVLKPHNFQEMHDLYTTQYFEWKGDEEKKKAEREYKAVSTKMLETANKFNFLNYQTETMCVIVAKSKTDLINEGSKLEHCVGRMNYDKRQAEGTSIICFVRKANDIDNPYVTVEMSNSCKVLQCYGIRDSKPNDETMAFVNMWSEMARKNLSKLQRGVA